MLWIDSYRMVPSSPPFPVDVVGSFAVFDETWLVDPSIAWLPGDYVICAVRNSTGTVTVPAWMSRIDGRSATALLAYMGGRIVDGLTEFGPRVVSGGISVVPHLTVDMSASTNGAVLVGAILRNVHTGTPVVNFAFDSMASGDTDIGPLSAGTLDVGLVFGLGTYAGSALTDGFKLATGGGVAALQEITDITNDRFGRLYSGGGPFTNHIFTWDGNNSGVLGDINEWAVLAAKGAPLTYTPTGSVSFVGSGADTTGSGTTLTVPLPAGIAAGDLLMVVCHDYTSGGGFLDESGWARVLSLPAGNQKRAPCVYMKFAVGGDSDPTFDLSTPDTANGAHAKAHAYRGVQAIGMVQTGAGLTLTPLRDTPVDGCMAIAVCAGDFFQPMGIGTANGYTSRGAVNVASTGGVISADKAVSSAGDPSFPVFTQTGGTVANSMLIYLYPA